MKLYGKNPVLERLKSNPKSVQKVFLEEGKSDLGAIHDAARRSNIPLFVVPRSKMIKLAQNVNSQGVLIEMEDFAYVDFDDLLRDAVSKKQTILFLDSIQDPQNFGAIIRSAACLGGFSIVIPVHDSVEVTDAVMRVASGGDNYVSIAKVNNLKNAIESAKKEGFWIAGTVVENGKNVWNVDLPFPLALVLGSEQKGIRESLHKTIDIFLTLPMPQAKLSFNVSHAATIFCYEITRQKSQ